MSNQIFNFNSTPVRVELFDNQPHFCLLDVCEIFEIQNSRRVQSQMLDPQGVRQAYILARDEKQRKTSFINEPNLYRIIFRSEKPIAKDFQNWVFEEVLPQIRKTGQYSQKSTEIAPLTITPEQQQQIQNAVQATHHRTGLSYAEIYQRLKAKFHIAKYDQLRQDQHQEALTFIAGLSATMARTEIVPAEPITPSIISLSAEQVFPLIVFHSKWKKAVADLVPIYEHLKRKGDVALADIVSSHFDTLNQNTALFDQVEMTLNHCVAKMQHSEESRLLRYFLF